MPPSIFLARLIGPVLAVLGIAMLLDPQGYLAMVEDFLANRPLIYVSAALGLLGGVALVLANNIWAANWRIIITLLGWISIIDSTFWLLMPRAMQRAVNPLLTPTMPLIAGAVTVLLGIVLCYFGYLASGRIGRKQ
jgi:hypothetical protein